MIDDNSRPLLSSAFPTRQGNQDRKDFFASFTLLTINDFQSLTWGIHFCARFSKNLTKPLSPPNFLLKNSSPFFSLVQGKFHLDVLAVHGGGGGGGGKMNFSANSWRLSILELSFRLLRRKEIREGKPRLPWANQFFPSVCVRRRRKGNEYRRVARKLRVGGSEERMKEKKKK